MWRSTAKIAMAILLLFSTLLLTPCAASRSEIAASGSGSLVPEDGNLEPWASAIFNFTSVDLRAAPTPEAKYPLLLAAKRTRRPDVLNRLKHYRGGWDITNKHYWTSVLSTGAAAFILAFCWFLLFGLSLCARCCCKCDLSFKYRSSSHSRQICLAFLLIFTCAAMIGCILLSVGQAEFHNEVSDTLNFVVNQSDFTVQILRNVTKYLSLAKAINVDEVILPSDVQSEIDKLDVNLDNAATTLSNKTEENSIKFRHAFYEVRCALIAIAAVMLFLALVGFLLSIFRHTHAIYIFILSGWLLVAVTFIFCGVFVILRSVISDTCLAMDEWVDNPHAETALSNVLPCVDEKTSNTTLHQSKEVTRQLVKVVNTVISTIANSNDLTGKAAYYNQSGPPMPFLCSPYDPQLKDRQCVPQEVSLGNASQAWLDYRCEVSEAGICISAGRVTPDIYTQLVGAVNVSYALDRYTLPLLNLQNCNFVRDTFHAITATYCPQLTHDLQIINAGLGMISAGVMLCLVLWILYANRPQREEVFAELSELKVVSDATISTEMVRAAT